MGRSGRCPASSRSRSRCDGTTCDASSCRPAPARRRASSRDSRSPRLRRSRTSRSSSPAADAPARRGTASRTAWSSPRGRSGGRTGRTWTRGPRTPWERTLRPGRGGRRRAPPRAPTSSRCEARRRRGGRWRSPLAGGHCLALVGPPGSGKTLIARTIPSLLPPLGDGEALAATIVASAAGHGPFTTLVRRRPFRAPHHTASYAAMVGGGPGPSPGEVSLASDGVLFLDELPEFGRDVLEALRQPLEDGLVTVARAGRSMVFPARFQLVAAMNPCPCGHAGDPDVPCRCPAGVPERYAGRVSGPLRDRIDLWAWMPRLATADLLRPADPEASAVVRARIELAWEAQLRRGGGLPNGRLAGRRLRRVARSHAGGRAPARRGGGGRPALREGCGTAAPGRSDHRGPRRCRAGAPGARRRGGPVPSRCGGPGAVSAR